MRHRQNWHTQRFYRDPLHGRLMGVCAGAAECVGVDVTIIRILAIMALFWFSALTAVVYVILGFVLPIRPAVLDDWGAEDPYSRRGY